MNFDEVLGLKLSEATSEKARIPENIRDLMEKREQLRLEGKFGEADKIREEIVRLGYSVADRQIK
jgi:cysteinyl-tRNA synthetase